MQSVGSISALALNLPEFSGGEMKGGEWRCSLRNWARSERQNRGRGLLQDAQMRATQLGQRPRACSLRGCRPPRRGDARPLGRPRTAAPLCGAGVHSPLRTGPQARVRSAAAMEDVDDVDDCARDSGLRRGGGCAGHRPRPSGLEGGACRSAS